MQSDRFWTVVSQVYDNVHLALWSLLIAALIFFGAFVVPNLPTARARYEATRVLEVSSEQDAFCRKRGMTRGNADYRRCMLDLQEYRAKTERRLIEDSSF